MANEKTEVTLTEIRARVAEAGGDKPWRSLEELAGVDDFREYLQKEFPQQTAPSDLNSLDRRDFIKIMGASLALAGLTGCRTLPQRRIVPYVKQPESLVPGVPKFYATTYVQNGYGVGVLAQSHEFRPTRVEGNNRHPASLGASNVFMTASLLSMYDPDRAQTVKNLDQIATFDEFVRALRPLMLNQAALKGAGLRILTGTITSPTQHAQIASLLKKYPQAQWHQYEPINRDNAREGALTAFGRDVNTVYDFTRAKVVLSLDSNFLFDLPGSVRYAHDFAAARRVRADKPDTNRLYAVESAPTITGAFADHKLPAKPSQVAAIAKAVASRVGLGGSSRSVPGVEDKWLDAVAADLLANRGAAVVVAGRHQPAEVHALAYAMNVILGAVGATVIFTEPIEARPTDHLANIRELAAELEADKVDVLMIVGGNPAYDAPADLDFAKLIQKAQLSAHLHTHYNETGVMCHWHIPGTSYLEAWGDALAYDGTASIVQPLIQPLYGGKSPSEFLGALEGVTADGYTMVRDYWAKNGPAKGAAFEGAWQKWLHGGVIPDTARRPISVSVRTAGLPVTAPMTATPDLEVVFQPDPNVWDGEFSNNGWMMGMPRPLTHVTWENVVMVSPHTAEELGLGKIEFGTNRGPGRYVPVVELEIKGRKLRGPVWIQPGQADGVIVVHFGYGRTHSGAISNGRGFNAYALRTTANPWFAAGVTARNTGDRVDIASTQLQFSMEGRDILRMGTIEDYRRDPKMQPHKGHHGPYREGVLPPSIYPEYTYDDHKWGMAIDNSTCIACNACVVACQSENNTPVVSKAQILRGRAMHWIRIDTYHVGNVDHPKIVHTPVMCQHCEKAPCEPVCPVGATMHDEEGLNVMVYNRCIGTRYCSNNCPYKVRRFNYLEYSDYSTPILKLMRNPNVTVRSRGVMEKCTYCIQRISAARINAKKENRRIRDGEVVTACQAACPTRTIYFGDLNDPKSEIVRQKAEPQNYSLLGELGTVPRTTYMARISNPNPDIDSAAHTSEGTER